MRAIAQINIKIANVFIWTYDEQFSVINFFYFPQLKKNKDTGPSQKFKRIQKYNNNTNMGNIWNSFTINTQTFIELKCIK